MNPNPGDMIVQAVAEDLVIQDIQYSVPRGRPTTIPGNLACDSRDLGKYMSQKRIIKLDSNPRLDNILSTQPKIDPVESVQQPAINSEVVELQIHLQKARVELRVSATEVQRLTRELGESRAECGRLLAEGNQLRTELAKLKEEDSKLSTILSKIDSMPTKVVIQASSDSPEGTTPAPDDDTPMFFQKLETPTKKMPVRTTTSDTDSVSKASKALRDYRKGKSR